MRGLDTWNKDKNYETRLTTTFLLSTSSMIGKTIIARTLKTGAKCQFVGKEAEHYIGHALA
jgi:hypothetical protein